jgi:hypothetical protein
MLQYYVHTGFGGFSSMLEQFFPGIITYVHRFSMLQYYGFPSILEQFFPGIIMHVHGFSMLQYYTPGVWRIFLYVGTIVSWDYVCMFTDFLCHSTTHWVWRIFPYTGRIPSRDNYVQDATLTNITEGRFFTGRFVPEDVLSRSLRTFCPAGRFVPLDVLSQGRFVPLDLLSQGRFVPGRLVSGRLVSGRFVYVPNQN